MAFCLYFPPLPSHAQTTLQPSNAERTASGRARLESPTRSAQTRLDVSIYSLCTIVTGLHTFAGLRTDSRSGGGGGGGPAEHSDMSGRGVPYPGMYVVRTTHSSSTGSYFSPPPDPNLLETSQKKA
jgi:hypothetical protein